MKVTLGLCIVIGELYHTTVMQNGRTGTTTECQRCGDVTRRPTQIFVVLIIHFYPLPSEPRKTYFWIIFSRKEIII
jgi:hypothetical protein